MSSTELVEVTDLVEPTHGRHGWQVVEVEFATPASLVSGTQYYVGITDGGYGGWAIQVLSCGLIDKTEPCGPPAGAEDTKWGGATDPLRVNGTDEDALTACMTLHINGPALDTLVATVEIDAFGVDDCVQHAHIEWTVPEEGSCEFEYIEIQRSDDLGVTWDVIAKVYTFAVVEFDDYESRRNTVVQYRGRVRLTGGGIGVMSSVEAVTVPLPCSGLVFASNLLPDLASFYVDVGGERGYLLQENFQVMQFENRNYSVKISEMAYRGDVFDVVLVVGVTEGEVPGMGVVTATTPGRSQFDRLLDAVRPSRGATVPYVAVMNENGDRWFATLDTPAGQVTVNRFHKARVRVLEVTDNPYPVAIAVDG